MMSLPRSHFRSFLLTAALVLGALWPATTRAAVINISSPTVSEGNAGTTIVTFNITCDPCSSVNAIVNWSTMDGTATVADNDYVAKSGKIDDLGNGTAVETYPIEVMVNGDTMAEGDETFTLKVTSASVGCPSLGGPGGCPTPPTAAVGTATIQDDGDAANSPPTADAGTDETIECAAPGGTSVQLDGSGSSDPDLDSLSYSWTGPFPEGGGITTGEMPTVTLPLGVHVITLDVNDGNGETDTDTVAITIADISDPVVSLNGASELTLECSIDTYSELGATALDTCEGALPVNTSGAVDVSMTGSYVVTYSATDSSGNSGSETRTVHVEDTEPPVITLNGPSTVTLECGVDSYFEEGASAFDACDGSVPVGISGSVDDQTPGTYVITYTATDAEGNLATEERTVEVVDTTPPEITVSADPVVLWPPDHEYRTLSLDDIVLSATDLCDESVSVSDVTVSSVSSDEPEDVKGGGDGKTTDDVVIAGDCRSVDLRAERQGGGNGRVYTIDMAVSDSSGNTATASFEVHVPHDKKGTALDDGPADTVAGCAAAASSNAGSSTRFKGKVVDIEDGGALAGVAVMGPGGARVRTDENGRYTLQVDGGLDSYQIRLQADGYVTRNTHLDARKKVNRATLSMIPELKSIDMEFFDQILRGSDDDGTPRSRRWVDEPVFEFFSRQFEEQAGRSTALAGDRLPKRLRQALESWVRADVPLYTGGVLKGDQVRWVKTKRGDEIEQSRPGVIQVLVSAGTTCVEGASAVAEVGWSEPGILESGRVELMANCGGLDRGAFSHQLAHQLGFFHPREGNGTVLPSIMSDAESDGPTAADTLHGQVLYQRFPGNRAPDKDPDPRRFGSRE